MSVQLRSFYSFQINMILLYDQRIENLRTTIANTVQTTLSSDPDDV